MLVTVIVIDQQNEFKLEYIYYVTIVTGSAHSIKFEVIFISNLLF